MTIERFMYEGSDGEFYAKLVNDPVFPLVRELNFKYGLRVLDTPARMRDPLLGQMCNSYYMCDKNGLIVGSAFANPDAKKDGGEHGATMTITEYMYSSNYIRKQRGQNNDDKQTLRSGKVSALMGAIQRTNAIFKGSSDLYAKHADSAASLLKNSLGDSGKRHDFTPSEVHALVAHCLGVSPDTLGLKVDLDKCQKQLDIMNKADRIAKQKKDELSRFFDNPYWQIGFDSLGHAIIGKVQREKVEAPLPGHRYVEIIPFKRYRNWQDCEETRALLTIVKAAYENKQGDRSKDAVYPIQDAYDADLDAVFWYPSSPTAYNHSWMFTPAGDA